MVIDHLQTTFAVVMTGIRVAQRFDRAVKTQQRPAQGRGDHGREDADKDEIDRGDPSERTVHLHPGPAGTNQQPAADQGHGGGREARGAPAGQGRHDHGGQQDHEAGQVAVIG